MRYRSFWIWERSVSVGVSGNGNSETEILTRGRSSQRCAREILSFAPLKFGDSINEVHRRDVKLLLVWMTVATMAHAQTAGSNYKLPRQTLATSSAESVRTIRAILANHDARKLSEWDQETLKLYQQNDIRMLNRGTTIVVDKVDAANGMIQFHLPGAQASKPLFAVLAANQTMNGELQ
jgi:hypothetical protein